MYCSFFEKESTIYNYCKIVGFTGGGDDSARSRRLSGSSSFSISSAVSSASYYTEYFDQWLVLELMDGRLAYIPPGAVKYIEQASGGQGK